MRLYHESKKAAAQISRFTVNEAIWLLPIPPHSERCPTTTSHPPLRRLAFSRILRPTMSQ
jgi:hypothetical protein